MAASGLPLAATAPLPGPGLLRIADAARAVGVSPSALRLWERQGLVRPTRDQGGQRRYGADDLARLRRIRRFRQADGFNAPAILRLLAAPGVDPAGEAGTVRDEELRENRDGTSLAARLRGLRAIAGLSLRAVAARTGLSPSFISAVERGTSGASLAALKRLTAAYGVTVAALAREPAFETGRVVRHDARPVLEAGHGVRIEDLASPASGLQSQLFVLAPGATSDGAYAHPGEEFMYVLGGRITVWIDEAERHDLAAGDAISFPSSLLHRFAVQGPDESRVLWINTPATF